VRAHGELARGAPVGAGARTRSLSELPIRSDYDRQNARFGSLFDEFVEFASGSCHRRVVRFADSDSLLGSYKGIA